MTALSFITSFMQAIADDGGLVFLFVVIFVTGVRKVWLFRRELERVEVQLTDERISHMRELHDVKSERDQWRNICLWQTGHPSITSNPGEPPAAEGD
jgi:hypothetical protein